MITVLIAEDRIDHQTYLYMACNDTHIKCVGIAGNGLDTIRKARELKPDVILMDIGLPDMNGIECMRKIMEDASLSPRFIVCTVHEEDEVIFEALKAGAHAYIVKKSKPYQIADAIKDVYRGERPISSSIATKILAQIPMLKSRKEESAAASLTVKEKDILKLLSKGLSYQEIADHAEITVKTLKWHVHNIYNKLQADNRTEAINRYFGYEA
jgi:two-component system, NarL family, response regulator LiaR